VGAGRVLPSGAPALVVRNISVRFSGILACSDVSFEIHPGETFAVIGPNGAGKTTLVNAITGAVRAERGGSIQLSAGGTVHDLLHLRPDRIVRLGLIRTFQNVVLIPGLSVRENVMVARYVHQRSGIVRNMLGTPGARREAAEHAQIVDGILDSMGLSKFANSSVTQLAYGLRKRVELARALALQPRVLLLDEPVAGMSLEERSEMAAYIRLAQQSSTDLAVLLIEHDMRFVMSLADRVLAMNYGAVLAVGTPEEIQNEPQVLEAYLGTDDRKPPVEESA
jgi:branched-chain amino acid transport system ATP-binding protein